MKVRNPVAKVNNEYNKPKTFRNRKKDYARKNRFSEEELAHPVHRPYHKEHKNWTKEALLNDDPDTDLT